ncbi:uncharacterized protein LOC132545047 [Ylistrum balloti]|uniref:uncharacterized protein LOC132545047 n=1 Tax=Ylistrum balloti TaxID=509963 RepID=UPI002905A971|nr:uncharacterized protein LOC132545047 [Ylistrum balloti]
MSSGFHLHNALNRHDVDICGISEHWLFEENSHLFQSIHNSYDSHVICDFSSHPHADRRTRKGGVALMWRKRLSDMTVVIDSDDDRIAIIKVVMEDTVFYVVQVYFPTMRYGMDLFRSYVDKLDELYTRLSADGLVIFIGDFNAPLSGPRVSTGPNPQGIALQHFLDLNQLTAVNTLFTCLGPVNSYVHGDDTACSLVDYVMVDSGKIDLVTECKTSDDSFLDVSNHRAIFFVIRTPEGVLHNSNSANTLERTSFKWITAGNNRNTDVYRNTVERLLRVSGLVERDISTCNEIETFTSDLVGVIKEASLTSLPVKKFRTFLKPYWKGQLKDLHKKMWNLRCVWVKLGRPRGDNSESFRLYKEAKCNFRRAHRRLSEEHLQKQNDDVAEAAEVDQQTFWTLVKRRCKRSEGTASAEMIFDGQTVRNPQELVVHWGTYFSSLYKQSESADYDDAFKMFVDSKMKTILDQPSVSSHFRSFIAYEVKAICKKLPLGKAPGHDNLVYEHFINGGEHLYHCLTKLFNAIMFHEFFT